MADSSPVNASLYDTSSMMLHPPSEVIGESVTAIATSTASELEQIWDEVGYTPEERAAQISELLTVLQRICEDKVTEERDVAAQFKTTIADLKEELQQSGAALKVDVDTSLLDEKVGHM